MSDERTTEELAAIIIDHLDCECGDVDWHATEAIDELTRRANEATVYERAWHIIFRASGHDRCCEEALVEARKELGL